MVGNGISEPSTVFGIRFVVQTTRWEISPHPKPGAGGFLTIPSLQQPSAVTSVRLAGEVVDVDSEYRKPLDLVRQFSNGK